MTGATLQPSRQCMGCPPFGMTAVMPPVHAPVHRSCALTTPVSVAMALHTPSDGCGGFLHVSPRYRVFEGTPDSSVALLSVHRQRAACNGCSGSLLFTHMQGGGLHAGGLRV